METLSQEQVSWTVSFLFFLPSVYSYFSPMPSFISLLFCPPSNISSVFPFSFSFSFRTFSPDNPLLPSTLYTFLSSICIYSCRPLSCFLSCPTLFYCSTLFSFMQYPYILSLPCLLEATRLHAILLIINLNSVM